jgi:hypothetical protein
MPNRMVRTIPAVAVTVLLGACEFFTAPDARAVVGIVEWAEPAPVYAGLHAAAVGDPMALPVLEAPDTVVAGQPFEVLVRTYGSNGCWREAGSAVEGSGLTRTVTPYDRNPAAEDRTIACPDVVVRLPRTARLTFSEPGEAVLRVLGRRMVGGEAPDDELAEIEHRMVVR